MKIYIWNGKLYYNIIFNVTKGTRQGTIVLLILFNMFISDLLNELKSSYYGAYIGNEVYISFEYTNDITHLASTIPATQHIINICAKYN